MNFYLLIAGTRSYNDFNTVVTIADNMLSTKVAAGYTIHIVEGGAEGADELAWHYAALRGYEVSEFPADWDHLGKRAGYVRNCHMHEYIAKFPERGCLCFWDGASKGTAHNFKLSKTHGTQLRVFNYTKGRFVTM